MYVPFQSERAFEAVIVRCKAWTATALGYTQDDYFIADTIDIP